MGKINYNNYFNAVLNDDSAALNELTPQISDILYRFLLIRYGASRDDALGCVQTTLFRGVKKIKEGGIEKPDSLLPYFFTTAKHELFRLTRSKHSKNVEYVAEEHGTEAYQLKGLMDEERMSVLSDCIQALSPTSRQYILYWLKHPDYNAQDVANHFGISLNAAWTRKHRILKVLQTCCEKKLAK